MTPTAFRRLCPALEHYSPAKAFNPELGLRTASQILDMSADSQGVVWAKFLHDNEYQPYSRDHWKAHSRFKRRAGEVGCNLIVKDASVEDRSYILGNNFPLGDGSCLGTTIRLNHNRPGDREITREDWFRILNGMFWVFDAPYVNPGVLNHLRAAAQNGALVRVRIETTALADEQIAEKIRVSAINGGGSNGACPRGTATYQLLSEWAGRWPPKEIGILDGLSASLCSDLLKTGGLVASIV